MVERIPSTLMRSVDPESGEIVYVDRPSFFQEFSYDWQRSGCFGRIGLAIKLVCVSPFLLFGCVLSLFVFAVDMAV
jgi:hypothetical protein